MTGLLLLLAPQAERPAWPRAELTKVPETYAAPKDLDRQGMRALFYEGLPWKGRPTKVFAWLGVPPHPPGTKVPGVVFIHGGGGTASDSVVRLWNSRGYACLSMDTTGSYPGRNMEQHKDGGPRGNGENFAQIDQPLADQWTYQAVGLVARANSLLRSLPDVDEDKVGLTGLSWGGVLAATVAGIDDRFRWVAPVYGCGFLGESESFRPVVAAYGGPRWTALWDASVYLPKARMPMLWIDGTNDEYFQLGMWGDSYRLAKGPRTIALKLRMNHSGEDGERPEEIRAFADSIVKGKRPLPSFSNVKRKGREASGTVRRAVKAELFFTRDRGPWKSRKWEGAPAELDPNGRRSTVKATLPEGASTWYLQATDDRGLSVTTDFEEIPSATSLP